MSHVAAYSRARGSSRLATATSSIFGDSCAPGISLRLMSAVERIPHFTASAMTCVLSRSGGDRRWDARLRVHGQGAFERVPQALVHGVAAAARAATGRDRRAK